MVLQGKTSGVISLDHIYGYIIKFRGSFGRVNPLGNAGRRFGQGVQNAVNKASNGRLVDATKSVWDGTAKAAQEIGKSVGQATNLEEGI
ncbi:hypothetical protein NZD89_20315 [Alicyclobacillus fastidiosus]|uniref:Uncharacterized protein n=1 Tax=Alicyclobacillus fastidiosus TaxID=392011 RepID=A0ABY6ZEP1_9BACL|nr:hypothetical protein [Alicyclobacillus fastidiosus]WAH40634.1 hypothetical protein NZD89_20315 [Alicyclobacillus fastidiosus]GMA62081.1 hypothetical protein GCM10025859_25210 [Alicyclobacillus fastidiosus]